DFTVRDDVEAALQEVDRLEEAIATLPAEVVEAVPVYLLRSVLRVLLAEPLSAAPALERGPDDWRALLQSEQQAAYARLAGDHRWREWRSVRRGQRGAEGGRAEAARAYALSALEALLGGEPARALDLARLVDLRGGKGAAWPDGSLEAVKAATGAVRQA